MHLNENGYQIFRQVKMGVSEIFFPIYSQDVEKYTKAIRDKETWVVTLDLAPIINQVDLCVVINFSELWSTLLNFIF